MFLCIVQSYTSSPSSSEVEFYILLKLIESIDSETDSDNSIFYYYTDVTVMNI